MKRCFTPLGCGSYLSSHDPRLVRSLVDSQGRSSLFAALQHDYGVELAYADEEIDATAADANLAEMLGLPKGAAILRIRQVIYSTKGKATIYGVGFYRSERHTLFIRRFR